MTARELFEAIGMVDEELIEDAGAPAPGRGRLVLLRRVLPAAACLVVMAGALLTWRLGGVTDSSLTGAPESYTADQAGGSQPEVAAAPESGAAEENLERDSAAFSVADALPAQVADAITPAAGNGGGPSLAISAGELLGTTADPAPTAWPDTLPVYRNRLADGGLDESGMQDTLRGVLQAMGKDPELAGNAALVYNWSQDQIDQADQIAADLLAKFGAGSMLEFWGGMAQLELTLEDGSSLTVRNDRKVSLTAGDTASLRPMTGDDLTQNADLLEGLGGFDMLTLPASHSWTDGSLLDASPLLTRSDAPGSLTGLETTGDGQLAAWTLSGAAAAEPVAELPVISLTEAEALLQNGGYLGVGYEGGEPSQGSIVDARLGYLSGDALYYVPVWQFTVDFGPAEEASYPAADPDTGAALHAYYTYQVPAVAADALTDLVTGTD